MATVTQNVSSPQALALTNAASADAATCTTPTGCDLLGGALIHKVVVGKSQEILMAIVAYLAEDRCVRASDGLPHRDERGTGDSIASVRRTAGVNLPVRTE